MTVYNCGPIYYTVCLSCLKFSFHCAKLSVPYRIVLFVLVFLCVCLFFNLSLKLPSCYCLFFLLKCLPYFRENLTFRLNVLNFTTYNTTCPQYASGLYCTSKSLEMISESKLSVPSLKFASENYCMCTETLNCLSKHLRLNKAM